MPRALQHETPRWADPDRINDDVYEPRYVWPGRMRIVHGQRARKLRKRGVPLLPLHKVHDLSGGVHARGGFEPCSGDRARYAWFEPEAAAESRELTRAVHCYLVATRPEPFGRKQWLRERLAQQRTELVTRAFFRDLDKTIVEYKLPPADPNGQANLYAHAFRTIAPDIVEFWRTHEAQTATGDTIDELAKIPTFPPHWTDEQRRDYVSKGYLLEVNERVVGHWGSPPLSLYVPLLHAPENEGGYMHDMSRASLRYECPGCVACPHDGVHPGEGVA